MAHLKTIWRSRVALMERAAKQFGVCVQYESHPDDDFLVAVAPEVDEKSSVIHSVVAVYNNLLEIEKSRDPKIVICGQCGSQGRSSDVSNPNNARCAHCNADFWLEESDFHDVNFSRYVAKVSMCLNRSIADLFAVFQKKGE